MHRIAPLVHALILTTVPALADVGAPPAAAPEGGSAERITDLERENGELRRQWGQMTLELDRLRKQNDELSRQLGEARRRIAELEGQTTGDVAQAAPATLRAAEEGDVRAEVERLRRENAALRDDKAELTQLAGLAPEADRVAAQQARLQTVSEDGVNVVRTRPEPLKVEAGTRADHVLTLVARPDAGSQAPVTAYLQTAFSGGIYSAGDALELVLDGSETVTLPATAYSANRRQTGVAGKRRINKDDETLTFTIDRPILDRLAQASTIAGRIGETRFTLDRDQAALFDAIQQRLR